MAESDVNTRSALTAQALPTVFNAALDPTLTYLLEREGVGMMNLRGDAGKAAFGHAISAAFGVKLPSAANSLARVEAREVVWLSPDEWLLCGAQADIDAVRVALGKKLAKQHHALNDVSGAMVRLTLCGADAGNLLAKACTLDLHPSVWTPTSAAQTLLAKAPALLLGRDAGGFDIVVRRSFVEYWWHWLLRAGAEYDLRTGRMTI